MDTVMEFMVKQDRWVELNGNTLEREVYTDEEFRGDIPADFSPVEAAMTYSCKALLDKNGLIYWEQKADAADFHAGTYLSIGLNNQTRFSRLFQAYKFNSYNTNMILALTKEDNSLVGILDMGNVGESSAITEMSSSSSGNVYNITDPSDEDHFSNIEKTVVDALPAPYDDRNDFTVADPFWTVLLKDEATSAYELRYFGLEAYSRSVSCMEGWYYEASLGVINDYRGMANFGNKRYVVIADGNQLYYYQYGWDAYGDVEYRGELMPLGEPLPAAVKTLSGMDVTTNLYKQKYPYDGQLGVALEDGSFFIYSVVEEKSENGTCTSVSLKQQFPNETTSEENKKFDKIVDVLYKLGEVKAAGTYTEESVQKLSDTIDAAKAIYENAESTTTDVASAVTSLQEAVSALKAVDNGENGNDTDNNISSGDSTSDGNNASEAAHSENHSTVGKALSPVCTLDFAVVAVPV